LTDLIGHASISSKLGGGNKNTSFDPTILCKYRKQVAPLYIERGSPWENGYVESFNGKMRDELLNREQIDTLKEAKVLLEQWRRHYNTTRPHSELGYKPPAPESRLGTITQPVLAELS
jgi:transposase InsO family protein